ncbi:MAG: glycosyltransferase family 2 protein [Selenomonadaceae bacterium]|nr:glycosyltransferase family 2 protein [Selenomonadaceae bacterium]MBP3721967.1 glycosyltransferase family 2 protein [Selenomonadaceae bacterium]
MSNNKLTAVILTNNEEYHIANAIESLRGLNADILVIDSGSTDNTIKIAESMGAKVVSEPWKNDFAYQRNLAKKHTNTPWLFFLDADERVTKELAENINRALDGEFFLYEIKRVTDSLGGAHKFGAFSPDYVKRLMPRVAEWVGKVHEHPECEYPLKRLKGEITHNPYKDWSAWLKKVNSYSEIFANDKKGKNFSALTPFFRASFGFIKMYIIKGGFMDGALGLNMSLAHAFYTFMKYVKVLEKNF